MRGRRHHGGPKVRRWIWAKIRADVATRVYPASPVDRTTSRLAAVVAGSLLMNIGYVGAFWTAMVAMGGSLISQQLLSPT